VLVDEGNVRVAYMSPSHKLAKAKRKEFDGKIMTSTIARLFLANYKIDEIDKKYNVLVIDEVSMMTNEQKEEILRTYPHHKLIFCGDVGYQLPPIDPGTLFNCDGIDKVIEHKYVYRFKCELLRAMAAEMRVALKAGKKTSLDIVRKWVERYYPSQIVKSVKGVYGIEDMILCATNFSCDGYSRQFAGRFEKEKYIINERSSHFDKGEIVVSNMQPFGGKVAHGFTAHRVQGETAENKLFIDTSMLFQAEHLYTMISRARRLEQIWLVDV
jgi:ATP-dependent exoDNAse (exonuclease V) alpha subunit